MERSRRAAPLCLIAALLLTAGCGVRPLSLDAPRTVRLGASLSLSGPARLIGMAQRSGIKLAQDEINSSHLLGSTSLEIVVEDDQSDREQAAAVFQQLIDTRHVAAILGPTLSDCALNVDPIAQQAAVPVLAISNSAGGITEIGNFIFRGNLSEGQVTPQVVSVVRKRLNMRSAALLYSDTDPNRSGSSGFKAALQNVGVRITTEQTVSRDQTDYSTAIEAIAASQPDVLFVVAQSSAAAQILVQARQDGLRGLPIVGSSSFTSDAVVRSAGEAAEGLIVGSAWSAQNQSPRNQQFVQSYRARYGVEPDQVAAEAYTGVYVLARALRDAHQNTDSHALRDALAQVRDVDTPLGLFSFTDAREPNYAPIVQIVHNGRFTPF